MELNNDIKDGQGEKGSNPALNMFMIISSS